jgi:hypothetical protein
MQILADRSAAVAFVAHYLLGSEPGPTASAPPDRVVFHHLLEDDRFMPLAGRYHRHYRLAPTFCSEVNLGAEAALATT